jgi:hypothetical protein
MVPVDPRMVKGTAAEGGGAFALLPGGAIAYTCRCRGIICSSAAAAYWG